MRRHFFFFLAATFSLCANESIKEPIEDSKELTPWFTGPLIAPIGTVVPYGSFALYPYVYYTVESNTYDSNWKERSQPNFYTLTSQLYGYFGLTSWMDFEIFPQFSYNRTQGQQSVHFGDLTAGLGFQLYPADASLWMPGVKFTILETFPTGKFNDLDPNKLGTDNTGSGTFATGLNLIFYKAYHLRDFHFLSVTLSADYTITLPMKVHGFNSYGGGFGTSGKVHPGNIFQGIVSFDFSLSRNWAVSLDTVWEHVDKAEFFGESGVDENGDAVLFDNPSSELFSLAPGLEYNFGPNLGISCGYWFSVMGRNATQFQSGIAELFYGY